MVFFIRGNKTPFVWSLSAFNLEEFLNWGKTSNPQIEVRPTAVPQKFKEKSDLDFSLLPSSEWCLGCGTINCPDWISLKRGELCLEHLSYSMIQWDRQTNQFVFLLLKPILLSGHSACTYMLWSISSCVTLSWLLEFCAVQYPKVWNMECPS